MSDYLNRKDETLADAPFPAFDTFKPDVVQAHYKY